MKPHKRDLMTRMLKRAARTRREHGMALLFTLCILSMALVTAMIFSSNSTTNRKIASVYVDSSSARILADGAVSRAILALMQSDNASYVCSYYGSNGPDNSSEAASDWIWKLERKGLYEFNNGPLRFKNAKYYDVSDIRCPSWEYIISRNNYGDASASTKHIYGRYAYVAIGQNDYLNPNAIGKTEYSDFNDETFETRLGRWTCEPDFIFDFTGSNNTGTYRDKINPEIIRTKYAALSDNWTDSDVFISDLLGKEAESVDPEDPEDPDAHLKMMIEQYFNVTGKGEYNKYRSDGTSISGLSNPELAKGEEYRFPLIREDWNTIDVAEVRDNISWFKNAKSNQLNTVNQTVANLINYNATETRQAVSDADWVTGEPTYTGNKRTPYINEVHADVMISGTIGRIMKDFYLEDPSNPASRKWIVWYTDCTYSHQITLNVETVNLYGNGEDGALAVKPPVLIGEISYEYCLKTDGPDGSDGKWQDGKTQNIRFDTATQPWGAPTITQSADGVYTTYSFTLDSGSFGSFTTPQRKGDRFGRLYEKPVGHESDFYKYIKIRNVKLRVDRVILYDNAGNADLALMPDATVNGGSLSAGYQFLGETEEREMGGIGADQHFYFDTQIDDPRFNLARKQWSTPSFTVADDTGSTLGAYNSNVSYKKDDTTSFDPYEEPENNKISTAYIRHKPMQSLWELGAIHRGSPWQTINLKFASADKTAFEDYKYGDGHLLDCVALATPDHIKDPVLGMINLNCVASFGGGNAPFAFKSLFTNFPIYKTFENMNQSGTAGKVSVVKGKSVDSDLEGDLDADTFARELSEAVTDAIRRGHLPRRTAVFPEKYSDSLMEHIIKRNVPDAESEEIFCRIVNLLKWNKQPIRRATVLVLAQTIRDLGGPGVTSVALSRTPPETEDEMWLDSGFQSYDKASGFRTGSSVSTSMYNCNVKYNQYDNLFDQITGEAKVIVRLEWDGSANNNKGQWIITRKEYAE